MNRNSIRKSYSSPRVIQKLNLEFALYALPLVLIVQAWLTYMLLPLNGDIGWLYTATHQWLDGKELYTEIVEVNPPIVFILFTPICLITDYFNVPEILSIKTYFFLLTALPTLISIKLVVRFLDNNYSKALLAALIIYLFLLEPGFNFSQRDHLAIIFFCPYLIIRYLESYESDFRSNYPVSLSIAIGVLASVAISLKPYFLLFPIFSELALLCIFKRNFVLKSPSLICLIGCCALLNLSILVFYPNYVTHMIELALATYWTYGKSLSTFNLQLYLPLLCFNVISTFVIKQVDLKKILIYLNFISTGCFLSFYLQSHYSYQFYPFEIMVIATTIVCVFGFIGYSFNIFQNYNFVRLFFIALFFTIVTAFISFTEKNSQLITQDFLTDPSRQLSKPLTASKNLINQKFSGKVVYVLSPNVWPATYISMYTEAIWASGFPAMWSLPAIDMLDRAPQLVPAAKYQRILKSEEFVVSLIVSELRKYQPAAIVVDASSPPSYFIDGFKFEDFLQSNAQLQIIMNEYEKDDEKLRILGNKQYLLFKRKSVN